MSPPHEPTRPTTLRLTSADFDAYSQPRVADRRAPRGDDARQVRSELRRRMLGWARGVAGRLAEIGIAVEANEEELDGRNGRGGKAQRIVFFLAPRDTDGASVRHAAVDCAHLALTFESTQVEVSIEVPAQALADVENLRARLQDPERVQELIALLDALPEPFAMGVSSAGPVDAGSRAAAAIPRAHEQVAASRIAQLLARAEQTKGALWIGWSVPRDVAIAHSALLDEQLEDAIVALGPAYKLIASEPAARAVPVHGKPVGEASGLRKKRKRRDADRFADPESRPGRDDRAGSRRRGRHKRRRGAHDGGRAEGKRDRRDGDSLSDATSSAVGDRDARPASPEARRSPPHAATARPVLRATHQDGPRIPTPRTTRPETSRKVLPAPDRAMRAIGRASAIAADKGSRVRVLAGPFVGKTGVVQELDGKGKARVMLGLLATWVALADLVTCGEGRPALTSSHRKPLAVR